MRFINIVKKSVTHCEDSHYQIALPLKNLSLVMPENRVQAERRALLLKRRFLKDARFREDYVTSLRFIWWPSDNFNQDLQEYRMTVHLFGVVSSPSCARMLKITSTSSHLMSSAPYYKIFISTIVLNPYPQVVKQLGTWIT